MAKLSMENIVVEWGSNRLVPLNEAGLERVASQNHPFVRKQIPLFPHSHLPIPSDTDSAHLAWGLGSCKMILMHVVWKPCFEKQWGKWFTKSFPTALFSSRKNFIWLTKFSIISRKSLNWYMLFCPELLLTCRSEILNVPWKYSLFWPVMTR